MAQGLPDLQLVAAVREQAPDALVVDFHHAHGDGDVFRGRAHLHLAEELVAKPGDNTLLLAGALAVHGEGLPAARLPVGEEATVVTLQDFVKQGPTSPVEHILLENVLLHHAVECKLVRLLIAAHGRHARDAVVGQARLGRCRVQLALIQRPDPQGHQHRVLLQDAEAAGRRAQRIVGGLVQACAEGRGRGAQLLRAWPVQRLELRKGGSAASPLLQQRLGALPLSRGFCREGGHSILRLPAAAPHAQKASPHRAPGPAAEGQQPSNGCGADVA
mmetsp:Transcript_122847/g.329991  ORF Transcript_122847/g.329991 Transcript_122847/m.329991 type:complete len:274 (-) Transcript_122847:2-823(-)